MVALGRVVLSRRERVIALQPWGKGLLGSTLRYVYEVRDAKDYFDNLPDVKVAPGMLKLAEHILNSKRATSIQRSLSTIMGEPWSKCFGRSRRAHRRPRSGRRHLHLMSSI